MKPLQSICLAVITSVGLLTGCAPTSVSEAQATSNEFFNLSPEERSVIETKICPNTTLLPVDLELLQMARDAAWAFNSEINFEVVPFQNILENATSWDSIFTTLTSIGVSPELGKTITKASSANSQIVGIAREFLVSAYGDRSGAEEMLSLVAAQRDIAEGQLEVTAICFDIANLGASAGGFQPSASAVNSLNELVEQTITSLKRDRVKQVRIEIAPCGVDDYVWSSNSVAQIEAFNKSGEATDCVIQELERAGIAFYPGNYGQVLVVLASIKK